MVERLVPMTAAISATVCLLRPSGPFASYIWRATAILWGVGIHLLGARNAALRDLVRQVPAPIVATQLGYSHQVTQRHAALAAEPMSKYASIKAGNAR